jgi:molybdopterin molybdotransferase
LLLGKGECINASTIALLASQGISHVEVYEKLRVVVVSTGDELKKPWEKANEDEIYDVNAFALIALLKEQGFNACYGGVIPDNEKKAIAYFKTMQSYDVIVSSGGVSMGEADFVEKALRANGFIASFHGINIKPGKPTMFGMMGQTLVASMPGNPLAAYTNAFLFLIPVLKKRSAHKRFYFDVSVATMQSALKLKSGRVNIVLGSLQGGQFCVYDNNRYGSGMITPLQESNALLVCDEQTQFIDAAQRIKAISFYSGFSQTIEQIKN